MWERPSWERYAFLIRRCARSRNFAEAKLLHSQIVTNGFGQDTYICNLLVHMYGKCGSLADAVSVFKNMSKLNGFSCNVMMNAYIQHEKLQEARCLFESSMGKDVVSWNSLLTAYARIGHLRDSKSMFDRMPVRNVVSWNAILGGCSTNDLVYHAKDAFDGMPERDVVSWNSMIGAFSKSRHLLRAREGFDKMPEHSVISWNVTIGAYVECGDFNEAAALFSRMPEQNTASWNSMITAFAHNGDLQQARKLFLSMSEKDVISWNSMISAYVKNGELVQARCLFDEMPTKSEGSWVTMITGYVQQGDVDEAKAVYDRMKDPNTVASTAMLSAFAQTGRVLEAKAVFDGMPLKDVICWSAMMTAYAQNCHAVEVLKLYRLRDMEGVPPDRSSFIVAIDACAILSDWTMGKVIHSLACESGLDLDVSVDNSLLSLYGRCSSLQNAKEVFDKMRSRDTVSWNAIMTAYAHNGHVQETLDLGHAMNLEGAEPDSITFINILSVCSHKGLFLDGWRYFTTMQTDHDICPNIDHYYCMIDLIARSGRLKDAEALIVNMPFEPHEIAWRTLLSACCTYLDSDRGARAVQSLTELGFATPGEYVMLANITRSLCIISWDTDVA